MKTHLDNETEHLIYTRHQLDEMIAQSIASLERGEGVDGEEFFTHLEKAGEYFTGNAPR